MDDLTKARAYYYEFLGRCLFFIDQKSEFERLNTQSQALSKFLILDENAKDFEIINSFCFETLKDEQNRIFFSFSYTNIALNASFYDEGRDNGLMRIKVANIVSKTKYRRNEAKCADGEDYIGFIFELMATLLNDEANLALSKDLFAIINDFSDEFCQMLQNAKGAKFYAAYANILQNFIAIEREIFDLKAPQKQVSQAKIAMAKKPYKSTNFE